MKCARIESKLRNIFNRSRFSPVTLEIWNIGHTLRKNYKIITVGRNDVTFVIVIVIVNVIVIVIVIVIMIVIVSCDVT